ncbi:nitroreductase family protein [soil metagenome]
MDTWLTIASRREVRRYADTELPADVVERILDAGRLAGSASNKQPWRFLVVESAELREKVAEHVYATDNVRGAKLAVALTVSGKGPISFDAGRAAQNMVLAAWNDGVGSCPNGMPDAEATGRLLGLRDDERLVIILSFGYPAEPRDPESRSAEEWSRRANRKPIDEIVTRL